MELVPWFADFEWQETSLIFALNFIICSKKNIFVYILDCQTNRRCGLSTEEDGYDYYTTASLGVEVTNTKVDCSCLCQQTDDCTAWTWVKDGENIH